MCRYSSRNDQLPAERTYIMCDYVRRRAGPPITASALPLYDSPDFASTNCSLPKVRRAPVRCANTAAYHRCYLSLMPLRHLGRIIAVPANIYNSTPAKSQTPWSMLAQSLQSVTFICQTSERTFNKFMQCNAMS